MYMQPSFRWYGAQDPVPLSFIRQAGAEGVVTSLHQIPYGEVWPMEAIQRRQQEVADAGLVWNVVESLPVHEDIKTRTGRYAEYIDHYRQSLRHLGSCGIRTITYNFMPVLDWVRTDLHYKLPDGSEALYFNRAQFAAFDVLILQRPGAEADYDVETMEAARQFHAGCDVESFTTGIIDNFPGFKGVKLSDIRQMLKRYEKLTRERLEENLRLFLEAVLPTAEESGCRLAIHPDDPPFPILGLPRIFSTADDVKRLLALAESPANGICFCSGSFSGRLDNDIVAMFRSCAERVNFLHLRSTQHDDHGNFFEANHLEGCVDMPALVAAVIAEQERRQQSGREDWRIPFRPDHGHTMLDDLTKAPCPNPGYTAIGRLKGLAELRGLELGLTAARSQRMPINRK